MAKPPAFFFCRPSFFLCVISILTLYKRILLLEFYQARKQKPIPDNLAHLLNLEINTDTQKHAALFSRIRA